MKKTSIRQNIEFFLCLRTEMSCNAIVGVPERPDPTIIINIIVAELQNLSLFFFTTWLEDLNAAAACIDDVKTIGG